jgi:hypothetical protein
MSGARLRAVRLSVIRLNAMTLINNLDWFDKYLDVISELFQSLLNLSSKADSPM